MKSYEDYIGLAEDHCRKAEKIEELFENGLEANIEDLLICYKNAVKNFKKVLEIKPQEKDVWIKLGDIYSYLTMLDTEKGPQHIEDAINAFLNALGKDLEILRKLGKVYIGGRNYGKAATCFHLYLQKHPSDNETWIDLADCYYFRGMYLLAQEYFKKALEIDPENLRALGMAARNQVEMGHFEEAIELYKRRSKLDTSHRPWMMLAKIYEEKLGRYNEATKYMEEAVKRNPDSWSMREKLGHCYFILGRGEKALSCWKKAIDLKMKVK